MNRATAAGWVAVIVAYNASDSYVQLVRTVADEYAARSRRAVGSSIGSPVVASPP